ncbi:MAG: hypothetical protein ABJM29_01690 [Rhizobiaceae bacterium]
MRLSIKDPSALAIMVALLIAYATLCLFVDPLLFKRLAPAAFSPWVIRLTEFGMMAQFFAVWSQAVATATANPSNIKWQSVNSFLLLQLVGGLLAWWSHLESVFVSMVMTFFGSCFIAWAKLKRQDQTSPAIGPSPKVQLGFVWIGLPIIYLILLELVSDWWAGSQPADWAATATLIVGPLMFFQIRAIWYIAISALREKDDISGFSMMGQYLLLTLQVSGTILSINAENIFLGYAMALSVVSTIITICTLLLKRYRWRGVQRPATDPVS